MKKYEILTTLFLLLGATSASAQGSDQYIRFRPGDTENDGALQIAVERWQTPDGKIVDLYGVVHIADKDYYHRVQQDLDKYDAVLYEGVGATREVMLERSRNKNKESASGLSNVQRLFGTVLGLEFQMDGIAYTSTNLVHADMGADTFKQETKGQSLNPLEQYVTPEQLENLKPLIELGGVLLEKWMESRPEIRSSLKVRFAQQISGADMTQQLPPQMYKTIVIDRNAIVMQVLADQLRDFPDKKTFSIFYGAAHMPDFAKRFEALGYKRVSTTWKTAWAIGQGPRQLEYERSLTPEKQRQQSGGF